MDQFSSIVRSLLRNYEGYFNFDNIEGLIIDDEIIFLTIPLSMTENEITAYAAANGYLSLLKCQKKPVDIFNLLTLATVNGHLSIITHLCGLSKYSSIFIYIIRYAAEYGHLNIIEYLDSRFPTSFDESTLLLALRNNHITVIKYFLDKYWSRVIQRVMINAIEKRQFGIIKGCFICNHSIDEILSDHLFLAKAYRKEYPEIFEYLLRQGCINHDDEFFFYREKLYNYLLRDK